MLATQKSSNFLVVRYIKNEAKRIAVSPMISYDKDLKKIVFANDFLRQRPPTAHSMIILTPCSGSQPFFLSLSLSPLPLLFFFFLLFTGKPLSGSKIKCGREGEKGREGRRRRGRGGGGEGRGGGEEGEREAWERERGMGEGRERGVYV